ncbi:cytochrome b5, partial [Cystobasidium minutum MCA 4210]|uniref:cytochrome b5 n=1 Tax=Cystobasidium minutum MCA 4210 TaxID=1397322 RepID=UPI0034CFAF7C
KEVESHNTEKSAWLIVDGGVYDVTEFLPEHPGGKKVLLKACGKDSSEQFWQFHSKRILTKTAAPMKIGVVGGSAKL